MREERLTLACVTKPNIDRIKVLLGKCLPFVDQVVLVEGERNAEFEKYLKSLQDPRIKCFYYKWHDNFAASWNAYLNNITDGWVLIVDDDEVPSDNMLNSLDGYINNSARGEKYCGVGFRCNNISEGQDMGPCDYYRQILFRYNPGMKYGSADPKSGCHQVLLGHQNNRIIKSRDNEVYYHIKSLRDEYKNASRNYWIYGLWISDQQIEQREEWHELKTISNRLFSDASTFPEFEAKLSSGPIPLDLIEWMKKWHTNLQEGSSYFVDHQGFEYWHYNEARSIIKYICAYLRPDQCPKEISF